MGHANEDGLTHDSSLMTLSGGLLDPPHGVPRHERKPCASPGYVLRLGMVATNPMVVGCSWGGKAPEEAEMCRQVQVWSGRVVQTDARAAANGKA
jgi:hypothetical protein